MKKPLVALAALSLLGLASAQSSVALYGIADFWVGKSQDKGMTAGSGGLAASRWGLKGKEDLGDGLEAGFVLEQVFDLASGAAEGGFNRQAYVSLAGHLGEVRLGNVLTPLDDLNGSANSGGDSLLAAISHVWVGFNANPMHQIYYATPEVAGLGAAVSRSLDGQRGRAVTSLRVNYNDGPLYAGLAWQADKQSAPGQTVRHVFANAAYDLGALKLLASARRVTHPDSGADRARETQLGLEAPLSDALVVSTGIARSTDSRAGLRVAQRQGYGLLLTYALSKRTALYGGLQRHTETLTNTAGRLTAAGVHHTF